MELGMIGLGRMGANMTERLVKGGPPRGRIRPQRGRAGAGRRHRRGIGDFARAARGRIEDTANGLADGSRRAASPTAP